MIEHLQTLTIWLDATGLDYTLKYETGSNKKPLCTVAIYYRYWRAFSANDQSIANIIQEIKQFLTL